MLTKQEKRNLGFHQKFTTVLNFLNHALLVQDLKVRPSHIKIGTRMDYMLHNIDGIVDAKAMLAKGLQMLTRVI